MQALTAPSLVALSASHLAQDTEDGELFVDGAGDFVFKNRYDRNTSTYAATFSNDGSDTPYRDLVWDRDYDYLRNVVSITDASGTLTADSDTTSVARFARRSLSRTSNSPTATEIADYAAWLVTEYGKAPRTAANLVLLHSTVTSNADWTELLSRKIGDLVSVENTPISGGAQNQWDMFVESIRISGNTETWVMDLGLSPAENQRMFTLDDPVLGKLDRSTQGLLGW
jgi:hypothetical protein